MAATVLEHFSCPSSPSFNISSRMLATSLGRIVLNPFASLFLFPLFRQSLFFRLLLRLWR